MTHPLEEVAAHLDEHAACIHPSDRTHHHIRDLASIVRAAIPDCECGELVRERMETVGNTIRFKRLRDAVGVYRASNRNADDGSILYRETLPAAVAAARANGAEGTPCSA